MKRTSLAALLAAPALLAFPGSSPAHPPQQCSYGMGCGGFCLNLWSKMHQHGPLFNYGPYYGYPPFCPYGPWNAYLQYDPSIGGPFGGGHGGGFGGGHGHDFYATHGDFTGHGGICTGGKHGGFHGTWSEGGWFHGHGAGAGCPSCGPGGCAVGALNPATTDAVARYAGAGRPADSAVFYPGLPTVMPAGGAAK